MLKVSQLETSYGISQVLFGIELNVQNGEIVTLLGRNGMGKSTIVNSIMGVVPSQAGEISFLNHRIERLPSYRRAQLGLSMVPEGRQIFPNLTVFENLIATAKETNSHFSNWTIDAIFNMFPILKERIKHMGSLLSGGEQQMLAIGRALMTNPRLLIFDEATEGLAPLVRQDIWQCIKHLKSEGLSILIIDKNIDDLTKIVDRHHILVKGKIVWEGTNKALIDNSHLLKQHLSF